MANFCPVVTDICVARGDSPVMTFQITDPSDGSVVDITGFTFVLTVDPEPFPADAVNNLFQVTAGPIVGGTTGQVQMQPTTVNTNQPASAYFYDLQMTTLTPSIRTILRGQFQIQQDVTKA